VKTAIADRILAAGLFLLLTALPARAGRLPTWIEFPGAQGLVRFNHADHAGRLECSQCHATPIPVPFGVEESFAHNTCLGCHRNGGTGPTACSQCHQGRPSPAPQTETAGQ